MLEINVQITGNLEKIICQIHTEVEERPAWLMTSTPSHTVDYLPILEQSTTNYMNTFEQYTSTISSHTYIHTYTCIYIHAY